MGFSGLKHETCGSLGTCYMKLPVIPGHEFSGRVTELGEGAKDHHKVDVGDLVVSEQIITCDKCRFCNKGQYQVNHNLKKKKKILKTSFLVALLCDKISTFNASFSQSQDSRQAEIYKP